MARKTRHPRTGASKGARSLPLPKKRAQEPGPEEAGSVPELEEPGRSGRWISPERPTVLLVEDRCTVSRFLTTALARNGYLVFSARNPEDALDAFVRARPQVVFVHLGILVEGTGRLIQQIRTVDPTAAVVIHGEGLTPSGRADMINRFDANGIYNVDDGPQALLELLACIAASSRSAEWMRHEHEARGLMIAKLCHALRTPLQVIQGYVEMLQRDPTAAAMDTVMSRVSQAVKQATELVHEYLEVARLDAAGPASRVERVEIEKLLADLRMLAERQIGSRPVRLHVGEVVPGSAVRTDGARLRAILGELLSNAIKFTAEGTVGLFVRSGSDTTQFLIADCGPGTSDDALPDLFAPFRQLTNDTMASVPGQGVGLTIALRLSATIRASLAVQRSPGGGMIFLVSVPGGLVKGDPWPKRNLH